MSPRRFVTLLALAVGFATGSARLSHAQWRVDGAPVSTAANGQIYPVILADGAGGVFIAWEDGRSGTSWDVYAQRLDGSGVPQWAAEGVGLCATTTNQLSPAIVSDGAGGAIVAWRDSRSGNLGIYAQRVDAAGVPQWTAGGVALCAGAYAQSGPRIASDGVGGAIIAWDDTRTGTSWDVYAQRVDAAGAVQWAAEGVALCAAPGDQDSPTIVLDGAGGAIVTWDDGRSSGTGWDIYAQRVDATGVPQWTADGVAVCIAPNGQTSAQAISDGAGGALIVWPDLRSGSSNYNIYVQHLLASGVDPAWPANGRALCVAAGHQQSPTIVSDGAGGAIVAWQDGRSGANGWDIFARRVDATGVPQWTVDGVPLCTAPNDQLSPKIVSDGSGGALVTWYSGDIYAQRVDATGVQQWIANGAPVCTAANGQYSPSIDTDGAGGAIVTWYDNRNPGTFDVYAQRIYGAGGVAAVPPSSVAGSFQLLPPSPNPALGGRLMVRFTLSSSSSVSAEVLDLAGHRVRTLATKREYSPGTQMLGWDGRNDAGVAVPSGVYFVEVHSGAHREARRVALIR